MTAQVVGQVVTGDAHEVVGDHAGIVRRVLLGTDIGVDGGQTLGHGAGAVHGGLVNQSDFQIDARFLLGGIRPLHDFVASTAAGHAAANQEDVNLFLDDLRISKFTSHFSTSL